MRPIGSTTKKVIIICAVLFDVIQLVIQIIPFIGQIAASAFSVLSFLTFYTWFKIYGVSFSSPKRFFSLGAGAFIETIPLLNILPGWTVSVLMIFATLKIQELSTPPPPRENSSPNQV